MSNDFYSGLAATALDLLTEFGQPVTVLQQGPQSMNTATGITAPTTTNSMSTYGALFDYIYRQYGNEVVKGAQIQSADKQLFMAATPSPPQVQDKVVVGGNTWAIVNIKQINPAGTPVLYELWLKR